MLTALLLAASFCAPAHAQAPPTAEAGLDALLAVGPLAQSFLEGARQAGLKPASLHAFPDSAAAVAALPDLVRPGDAVLVKGSRGVRMESIVEALVARFGRLEA